MSKGSTPTQQSSTVISEPSEFVKPYYEEALKGAQQLYQSDVPQYFPEATYVPFSGQTEAALRLQEQRALAGSPLLGQAQQQVSDVLTGQYLDPTQNIALQTGMQQAGLLSPIQAEIAKTAAGGYLDPTTNPYLQQAYQRAAGDVTSSLASQFAKAGRYGSGAMTETMGRSLGDIASQIYGGAYQQERARQLQAAGLAPSVAQAVTGLVSDPYQQERQRQLQTAQLAPGLSEQDYADISRLAQVGQTREGLQEAVLSDAMQRFQFEQQKPYTKLREYLASIGAPAGQQTVSAQPIYRNLGANLLGGATSGAYLGSLIPGVGAGLGAIGGGLLGGFF